LFRKRQKQDVFVGACMDVLAAFPNNPPKRGISKLLSILR
jgi:hypothetical protein